MTMGILIISGPPGSGKSSVAKKVAEISEHERVVHIMSDDFYSYISKGYIQPWLAEAETQNRVVIESLMECAVSYALGGYEVIIDGVIGLPYLQTLRRAALRGVDIRYIVLRPDLRTTIKRGTERQGVNDLRDAGVLEQMWNYFSDLGEYEPHVVDTTDLSIDESAARIVNNQCLRLS